MLKCAIIDDEKDVSVIIKYFIESQGIPMKIEGLAFDGNEAVNLLSSKKFDLVFLDIQMPFYNGLEIMEKFPEYKYIIISAFELFEYVQKALQLGAVDYLTKPINREMFIKSVSRAIGIKYTENDLINNVLEKLRTEYNTKINLSTIANDLGYHHVYLARKFKEVTGTTIMESLLEIRMKKAKELLLNDKSMTTLEVANLCGYSSMTSFYRDFKKIYSYSPKSLK